MILRILDIVLAVGYYRGPLCLTWPALPEPQFVSQPQPRGVALGGWDSGQSPMGLEGCWIDGLYVWVNCKQHVGCMPDRSGAYYDLFLRLWVVCGLWMVVVEMDGGRMRWLWEGGDGAVAEPRSFHTH
ncbi:uncharacterized protein BO72DRAFT_25752 [Aspergillus fijiensis CBS 313.89]|uniref:Uncharacterized protein n=1 Tax=Aspergillus fijiensis CBS 313.89 TaxID=1448319 RepID=A0A8G1RWE3_9EURO|nr:uncharacterized protein BO72DRAFT_25752 [Aspergillus fijiensis CBS 313.89]RAK79977.1 hypothetical protein BO72DRAFT_25752 [Aspergillus fijiensis CBS 313.89]